MVFKDIPGYEGYYQISSCGKVRSITRKCVKGQTRISRTMSQDVGRRGYHRVALNKKRIVKRFLVHRLVAEVFLNKVKGKNFVNHKDGNKSNNHFSNLEWVTASENIAHAYRIGKLDRRGSLNSCAKLNDGLVSEIRTKRKALNIKFKELAKMYGLSQSTVCNICNGKTWTHVD